MENFASCAKMGDQENCPHMIKRSQPLPSLLTANTFLSRLFVSMRRALIHFPVALRRYPLAAGALLLLGILRVWLNLQAGISFANALRPMLMGWFFAAFQIFLIDTIYFMLLSGKKGNPQSNATAEQPQHTNTGALVILLVVWIFWLLEIIHNLQASGAMAGKPVLRHFPGWMALQNLFQSAGEALHSIFPAIPVASASTLLSNLLLRMAIPLVLLALMGFLRGSRALTFDRWQIPAPFILIGLGAILAGGFDWPRLGLLGIGMLYPGLTEELFYRGWLQRALRGWLRPGYAVLAGALLFGLLHLPSFAAEAYAGMLPLALSNVIDVTLTGIVWGYGVLRTRSVLPWAVYHAVSNAAGF